VDEPPRAPKAMTGRIRKGLQVYLELLNL